MGSSRQGHSRSPKAFQKDSCRSTELASRRRALLCRWHRHTEARCQWFCCLLWPEEVITLLGGTLFVVCVTAKFSTELDQVALCARQLLLDLDESSIRLVVNLRSEVRVLWEDSYSYDRLDCILL